MDIGGRVVLITGASEGIGAACAAAFRRRGALLSLAARSQAGLERAGGGDALVTAADLTEAEARRRVEERTLERFGRIDILINNAGIGLYGPSWRAPMEQVRRMFELNWFAALELIQLVVPQMRQRSSGAIVNVSSIAGEVTLPWLTAYSASKAALCALDDGLRTELKPYGIQVTTVCPGYVQTGFQQHVLGGAPPERLARHRHFAITAERCAEAIARGVERNARRVRAPRAGGLLVAFHRLMPAVVDGRMARMYQDVGRAG